MRIGCGRPGERWRVGFAVVVLAGLLAACAGEPAASPVDGVSSDPPGPTATPVEGPDPDATEPDSAEGCDASHVFWNPDGIRETYPDLESSQLVDADREAIDILACWISERIKAGEPPMALFEALVSRYTSIPDPQTYRLDDWEVSHGRYGGLTPAQCAEWSVVSTLIVNADDAIIGDPGRMGPESSYVRWMGRCDG